MRSNVLVVMDIKPDRLTTTGLSLLNEALCSFGCNSVVARDSDDALRILSQDNISAVLCTVGLYNGTAFDLLQAACKLANYFSGFLANSASGLANYFSALQPQLTPLPKATLA